MQKPRPVASAMGMTVRDYLVFADARPHERFELLEGRPVAMSPATRNHQVIAGNIEYALKTRMRGRGCDVLRDFGLAKSEADDFMPQPDVMVRCGAIGGDKRWAYDPLVLFEVLSPSTEKIDRGYKRQRYFDIPTLQHLVLVDQKSAVLEVWTPQPDGTWPAAPSLLRSPGDILHLTALNEDIPASEIYLDL